MLIYIYFNAYIVYMSGTNRKMSLTGRPQDVAGVLTTSKLYALGDQILTFFPQVQNCCLLLSKLLLDT